MCIRDSDITEPGYDYTPFASVSENCRNNSITCVSPTKAFNLAGIQTAAVIVPNDNLRHKVVRGLNTDEVAEPNVDVYKRQDMSRPFPAGHRLHAILQIIHLR